MGALCQWYLWHCGGYSTVYNLGICYYGRACYLSVNLLLNLFGNGLWLVRILLLTCLILPRSNCLIYFWKRLWEFLHLNSYFYLFGNTSSFLQNWHTLSRSPKSKSKSRLTTGFSLTSDSPTTQPPPASHPGKFQRSKKQ